MRQKPCPQISNPKQDFAEEISLCQRVFFFQHTLWRTWGGCSPAEAPVTACVSAAIGELFVFRGLRNTFAETQTVCLSRLSQWQTRWGTARKSHSGDRSQQSNWQRSVLFSNGPTPPFQQGKTLHLPVPDSPGVEKMGFYIPAPVLALISVAMASARWPWQRSIRDIHLYKLDSMTHGCTLWWQRWPSGRFLIAGKHHKIATSSPVETGGE